MRDSGLLAAGRPGVITYSKKVFIPLTRLCRDRCHYCTFATTPGRVQAPFLSPDEVLAIAEAGRAMGCKEVLFTLGDRPEERWTAAAEWLEEAGYATTLDYVRAMSIRVLEATGMLPHLNPGVMSWQEMARLKPVAPSMGMMLETTSTAMFTEKSGAHYGSPDKDPAVRLRVLEDAGRSSVPFTTGILIGIGETLSDRVESIFAIRAGRPLLPGHPGSHHPELPGQAGHRDGPDARRRDRRADRHCRGGAAGSRSVGADPGAAEPDRGRAGDPRSSPG